MASCVCLSYPELVGLIKKYTRIPDNAPSSIVQSLAQERRSQQPRSRETHLTTAHPLVVIEDIGGNFKPLYKEFPPGRKGRSSFPVVNFDAPEGVCPFYPPHVAEEKNVAKQRAHREMENKRKVQEHKAFIALPVEARIARARKKGPKSGYCECCRVEYTDVNKVGLPLLPLFFHLPLSPHCCCCCCFCCRSSSTPPPSNT